MLFDAAGCDCAAAVPPYNRRIMLRQSCAGIARIAIVALGFVAAPASLGAQTQDEREVIAVVQKIFDAMAACDPAAARALSMPEGLLYRVAVGADVPIRTTTLEAFSAGLANCGQARLERLWQPQVRVHKDIATLWAPYDFWLDGKFSHCGIDSFEFVRTPDGWKLTGGNYTVEREDCAPSPLGPPRGGIR